MRREAAKMAALTISGMSIMRKLVELLRRVTRISDERRYGELEDDMNREQIKAVAATKIKGR